MADMGDIEKKVLETVDSHSGANGSDISAQDVLADFSPEEQRRIVRRIDWRLVTTVGAMYCVSLMDRTNLSAAAIAGMMTELRLSQSNRYSVVTLVFFITYVVFQPPSTVVVRRLGPRLHLSAITTLWGGVMIGMGFVRDWEQLAGMRVLLGALEAGFFPSCVYLLSTWYTRFEVGKRYSCFYMVGSVASAFSGILAFGLMQLNGRANLSGWRWIFIIEGVITCLLGIGGYWLLVGFPDSNKKVWNFLGPRELSYVIAKVEKDRADVKVQPFNLRKFMIAGLDLKVWGFAMIFFNSTTVAYALSYFLPIILRENMGFSVGASQCLVAPPYAFAAIIMYGNGWYGDRYRRRGLVILFNMVLCVIGLPIVGFHSSAAVRYFGVFLVTAGCNANVPATMSYQANNIRGQWKRAFCSATLVGFGGIGGIAGSLVFRSQDSPNYRPGLYACLACSLLTMIIVGLMSVRFTIANRKADRGEIKIETEEDDHDGTFRYTI